ncbi:MAG: DUF5119 domain-containing protein [Alistipes sp.]|nr:DUF5119 domain-containing protein [Alistipes sp.]
MKRLFTYMLSGALFFALAAETGCTKEALDHYKNEGFVDLELTWPEGAAPKGTRVHFYPVSAEGEALAAAEGEQAPVYKSFDCDATGLRNERLPVGSYKVLVYNSDTENLVLRDETDYDKATFHVMTESEAAAAGRKSASTRAGECITQPKNLFVANCVHDPANGQQLSVVTVPFRERVAVKAQPKAYVKTVILRFEVEGSDMVTLNGGTFIGVSPSHHCATAMCASTSESVNFQTELAMDDSGYDYKAEFTVLDLVKPTSTFGVHTVKLNIVPNGGDPYTVSADVTEVVEQFLKDNGGTIPVTIPVEVAIRLKKIDGVLTAVVQDWVPGTGGGTIGDPVE